MIMMTPIADRYEQVQERIRQTAVCAGRNPTEITLIAVTKTWPDEVLLAAYAAGMRHFGENRAEELAQKRPSLTNQLGPHHGIVWHFIGTVQSRKTNLIAEHADIFHALDRLKIAHRLASQLQANGRILPHFLEINISGEESKAGFDLSQWEENATQRQTLRTALQTIRELPNLPPIGLMTMAPWEAPDTEIRAVFRRTRQLAEWLQTELNLTEPLQLSMGMTDDFEIAIEEGATHIRVGRALFGERH